jgi:hypothetical protein
MVQLSSFMILRDKSILLKANIRRDLVLVGYFSVIAVLSIEIILTFSFTFYYDYLVSLIA